MMKLVNVFSREILEMKSFEFIGSLPHNCQSNSLPALMGRTHKMLIPRLL